MEKLYANQRYVFRKSPVMESILETFDEDKENFNVILNHQEIEPEFTNSANKPFRALRSKKQPGRL